MQRLKSLLKGRLKHDDRGASAVVVALMMVPIMILAALAIDIGAMHADRQQLQTGADAGALAIAQDCARDDCGDPESTARMMAGANLNAPGAEGAIIGPLDEASGQVTVQTSADREHWFAPVIGIDSTPLQAEASARWGYPTGGTAVMPFVISWCALEGQKGVIVERDSNGVVTGVDIPAATPATTLELAKLSDGSAPSCDGPSGGPTGGVNGKLPGGFSWLRPTTGSCQASSVINGWVGTDPGNNVPCNNEDFKKWVGKTVLLPIYYQVRGEGSNGEYRIFGYAAFTMSGYRFQGGVNYMAPAGCGGSDHCIRGSFNRFVDLTDDFDYSPNGPRLGAAVVALTE